MWENDLAREFKKRNNKKSIGPCVGVIQSISPLRASICDGQIMIDDSNGYTCKSVSEVFKTGDNVLIIPSGDDQKFFIVDVIRGGVLNVPANKR